VRAAWGGGLVRRADRLVGLALFVLAWHGAAIPVHAAQYSLGASLTGRVEYSDNLSLRVDENPGWRYTLLPALTFARATESNDISATASVGFNRYSRDDINEENDRALGISVAQRFERSEIGLDARYARLATALAQLEASNVNLGTDYTDRWSIAPYWTYSLSEKTTLQAGLGYSKTRYQRSVGTSNDEENRNISLGFSYALSPRGSIGLTLGYFEFDTSPRTSKSDSLSLSVTGSYQLSERTSLSGALGVQRTKSTATRDIFVCPVDQIFCDQGLVAPVLVQNQGDSTNTNFPFSLAWNWAKSERETVTVNASNTVGQYGTGGTTVSTSVGANYSRAISERLNFSLGARWSQSRTLERSDYGNNFSISPTLAYQISERWSAGAGYSYTRVSYADIDQDVEQNSVFASITYNWPVLQRSY
jgi:hypothetical protein